jgi:VIT1/CCC1 family predicted Fe2+/Mn2+ transporter
MALSKEQADAVFEALTTPARQAREETARRAELRELKRRKIMPLLSRFVALLIGATVGVLLYFFVLAERLSVVVALCMCISVGCAQLLWNRRIDA